MMLNFLNSEAVTRILHRGLRRVDERRYRVIILVFHIMQLNLATAREVLVRHYIGPYRIC